MTLPEAHGATIYTDYDKFLKHAGLEAIVIATVAGAYANQAIKTIEHDKHVLCEKPLSSSDFVLKSVSAIGLCAVHPELAEFSDVDDDVAIIEFWSGKIAALFTSRIMASGQHDMTETIGPKTMLVITSNPADSLVEMHKTGGIRRELPSDYYGRFEQAFVSEAKQFTDEFPDGTVLPFKLSGAVKVVEITTALTDSLQSGQKIHFDEQ